MVIKKIKVGINWREVQRDCFKYLLRGLMELNFFNGEFEELWKEQVIYKFMPHGLGHFIGFKVHDVSTPPKETENDESEPENPYIL